MGRPQRAAVGSQSCRASESLGKGPCCLPLVRKPGESAQQMK